MWCVFRSERTRWVEAVTPVQQTSENERIYETWDCPQVQAVHHYVAQQPDELTLEESDVINVHRKMSDGKEMIEFLIIFLIQNIYIVYNIL